MKGDQGLTLGSVTLSQNYRTPKKQKGKRRWGFSSAQETAGRAGSLGTCPARLLELESNW